MTIITRKTLFTPILAFGLVLTVNHVLAQFPGMRAVNANMNKHFANQQMRAMLQMHGLRGGTDEQITYDLQITFPDNSKKQIVSAIYTDTVLNKNYVVLVDKRYKKNDTNRVKRIYPSQTLYIARTQAEEGSAGDENARVKYFYGKPTDSCWMFKVKTGAVNAYSYTCME